MVCQQLEHYPLLTETELLEGGHLFGKGRRFCQTKAVSLEFRRVVKNMLTPQPPSINRLQVDQLSHITQQSCHPYIGLDVFKEVVNILEESTWGNRSKGEMC